MIKRALLILGVVSGMCQGWASFLPQTEDVPLMSDMVLAEQDDFSFDVPDGQILNVTAVTKNTPAAVRDFYKKSLRALGWTEVKADMYKRAGDVLILDVTTQNEQTVVRFDLTIAGSDL